MSKRRVCFMLTLMLVFTFVAGCANTGTPATTAAPTTASAAPSIPATSAPSAGATANDPRGGLVYPVSAEPITVTWFKELDSKTSVSKKSYGEVEAYIELSRITNINIEWQHPPTGQTTEQFNLMMASGDLTDIVQFGRTSYPGGPTKAITEKLILPLNDSIDQYAPNLKLVYAERPDFAKMARTDEGVYFAFPGHCSFELFQRAPELKPAFFTFGWQIRQDWLDKVQMDVPETTDEWYAVLTAFKTKDPNGNSLDDEVPMVFKGLEINQWVRAWGMHYDWYRIDDTVHFGAYEQDYKKFLETMNKWYIEGLLDVDYVTTDGKQFDAKITTNLAGAWTGATSGTLGRLVQLMKEKEPTAKLTGTVEPYVTGGKSYNFDGASFYPLDGSGSAISAKTKYAKEIAMLLDYGFSDEGDALLNWGIEGKSYTNTNGQFTLMDNITANEEGLSLDQALAQYAPGANGGNFFNSNSLWNQRMWMPEQQEAVSRWSVGSGERILSGISPTTEESTKMADIMNKVNTYKDEMLHKFIMGIVPMSEFDNYIKNLKDMGIEDAVAIQQAALDRYEKR